jgi:hypothetical protein
VRSEVSSGMPAYRLPVAQEEICFLFCLLFALSLARHIPLFNSDFASRSTPTKAKKVGVSESLTHLRALWWDTSYACLAFPAKPENETARCRSLQIFPSARRSLQALANTCCSCYKSGHAFTRLLPIRLHGVQSPLQLIQQRCLLLPTRSFPGRPRTPVRASFLAHGALCIDSR